MPPNPRIFPSMNFKKPLPAAIPPSFTSTTLAVAGILWSLTALPPTKTAPKPSTSVILGRPLGLMARAAMTTICPRRNSKTAATAVGVSPQILEKGEPTNAVPPQEPSNPSQQSAKRAAAAVWQCKPEQTFAQDLPASFPWIHKSTVFLLKSIDHKRMLVVVSSQGLATPFPPSKTVVALNHLFESASAELPKSLPPAILPAAIHALR